jgi:LacI family transcriptional regulator
MTRKSFRKAGIKDIADALGVSIGTVDRALHARPGVSPATCDKVLRMAQQLGYQPNMAARALKLNRTLRIAVQLPQEISLFYNPLRDGIRSGMEGSYGVNIETIFHDYPRLGAGDLQVLEGVLTEKYDGLLCTTSDPVKAGPIIDELQRRGTAVVCVNSDAPRSDRIASVAIDGYISGSLAAELLSYAIPGGGPVATITGSLRINDHAEKLRGFAAGLALLAPRLMLLPVLESHDNPSEAYAGTADLLDRHANLQGLYISTANSLPVIQAIQEKKRAGNIRIVTTDIFPELATMIETGEVMATLYQRPFTQGKTAAQSLVQYLVTRTPPVPISRLMPHVVMRGNLSAFTGYVNNQP